MEDCILVETCDVRSSNGEDTLLSIWATGEASRESDGVTRCNRGRDKADSAALCHRIAAEDTTTEDCGHVH